MNEWQMLHALAPEICVREENHLFQLNIPVNFE